jgi:hypothetical protein
MVIGNPGGTTVSVYSPVVLFGDGLTGGPPPAPGAIGDVGLLDAEFIEVMRTEKPAGTKVNVCDGQPGDVGAP